MLCLFSAGEAWSQSGLPTEATRNWAWDQVKAWTYTKRDARGQALGYDRTFFELTHEQQIEQLLDRLTQGDASSRRAALIVLGDRPLEQWAPAALREAPDRDEVARFLYAKGYRDPDKDPFTYLEPSARVDRPWTHGLGLHLDAPDTWRFQWISSPALLPRVDAGGVLPKALERSAQPTAILRLKQLRPGLVRLQSLAGGREGMIPALAQGSRAGFFVKHLEIWLKQSSVALEPLASREAWVLHYGLSRPQGGPSEGTLVFLPGELPTRTKLALELLKLNPTSSGPRSRTLTWKGSNGETVDVAQVRGAGGVFHLVAMPEGTWISDREGPLRSVLFPAGEVTLAERPEWCKVALAGVRAQTDVSLWLLPRLGAGASFERTALRRRILGIQQKTWNNPFIAKGAPRTGTLSVSLGAGPTELLLAAILRKDQEAPIEERDLPAIADGGQNLSPQQMAAFTTELQADASRNDVRRALRSETNTLLALLDLRGAALYWKGWVAPPALSGEEKAALAAFQKLQQESSYEAARQQFKGKLGFFGGFGEPGMTPSLALALPIQAGKATALDAAIRKLWPRLFKGRMENREYAKGLFLRRTRTDQAFAPCYVIVGDTLVIGSDDAAVQTVVGGLLGQTTTLADLQRTSYGVAQIDGTSAARDLEVLLLSYLRSLGGDGPWWSGVSMPSGDEAAAEVASTFGPFLGALQGLGTRTLELEWTSAGLEARPK